MLNKVIVSVFVVFSLISTSFAIICQKGEGKLCQPLPSNPGCNKRPNCLIEGTDQPCDPATIFPDACFCNAYYECSHGVPVPFICPEGTVVNPAATGVNTTEIGVCIWPTETLISNCDLNCGCNNTCNIPPVCPSPIITEDEEGSGLGRDVDISGCTGTILLPHSCDCQFFWTCRDDIPILSVCGAGFFFQPDGNNGGACTAVGDVSIPENVACLSSFKEKASMLMKLKIPEPVLPVAPVAPKRRHPLVDLLMAQNVPIPSYLLRYTKL